MPNTTIYLDNETYIKFLKKPDVVRTKIRLMAAELIKQEVR